MVTDKTEGIVEKPQQHTDYRKPTMLAHKLFHEKKKNVKIKECNFKKQVLIM